MHYTMSFVFAEHQKCTRNRVIEIAVKLIKMDNFKEMATKQTRSNISVDLSFIE